jgi:hypothetical protein
MIRYRLENPRVTAADRRQFPGVSGIHGGMTIAGWPRMHKLSWLGALVLLAGCGSINSEPIDGGSTGEGGSILTGRGGHPMGGAGAGGAAGQVGNPGTAGQGGAGGTAGAPGHGGKGGSGHAGTGGGEAGGGGAAGKGGSGAAGAAGSGHGGTGGQAGGAAGGGAAGKGGSGTAGSGGGTGGAGGDTTCSDLETAYTKALKNAKTCDATKTGQCQDLVGSSLACAGCQTHVNDTTKLTELQKQWTAAGCDTPIRVCPALACVAPDTGVCSSGTNGDSCTDQVLTPLPTAH